MSTDRRTTFLRNARILTNGTVLQQHTVVIEGAYILAVVPESDIGMGRDERSFDLGGHSLAAGFIDTQVNGGGGVLFNDEPSVATIRTIGAAHRRFGTTGFLPTLISDDPPVLEQAIRAVQDAIAQGVPGVLGIHIEGPFLSPARKGIHDPDKFRILGEEALELLVAPRRGCTVLTLAPEMTTPATIRRLAQAGIIVCAGHTDASYSAIRTALDHGLRGFTHLFNAMSPLMSRAPGTVGAALEDRGSWCSLIVDGHHVAPAVLRIASYCKPPEKLILVTDAMSMVGVPPDLTIRERRFNLQGRPVLLHDGVCRDGNGVLAGSNLDMVSAVRNSVSLMHVTRAQAMQMASAIPADFLGLSHELGRIAPGQRANLVMLDDAFNVLETWIDGHTA